MERPNPDELLEKINAEETHRGKLKIFFGAAAGVGKTYTMLETARARKKEGVDVVVGFVETHKRVETEALLDGLEILPSRIIPYKNVDLREFDIDAALARNPSLILVDELAHTNAPGSRHPKRWQDVAELLSKGIDVYTTLNVQHCESATDVVAQVTGIVVHETVPDTFVEKADEIELVDLPTEDLLKRLKDGKVYLGDQAERAAQHFFQPGNLIALRQLALRYTAHNVDDKLLSYKKAHAISKVWNVRDRFLVCVSPSPNAMRLVRAGKRIASDLGAEWIVAYVETPAVLRPEDKARVSEMLRIAEILGAEVVTLSGPEVTEPLISYARAKNINKIIIGKPGKPGLKEFIFGSIIDQLARKCGEIDLYLLSGDIEGAVIRPLPSPLRPFSWINLSWTVGLLALCTAVNKLLFPHLHLVNSVMIYLLAVTWIAFKFGRRMSIIASFLSVLLFDFFLVPPYLTFAIRDFQHLISFFVMLVVGLSVAQLTGQLKRQTVIMRFREARNQALYSLSRDLSKSSYADELFKIALRHIQDFLKCPAVIFAAGADNRLVLRFGETEGSKLTPDELAVAQWAFEHKKAAGRGTDTLPGSRGIYLPFVGSEKTVGVIGIFTKNDTELLEPDHFHMVEMFVAQTALAVEGAQLAAAALDAESKVENEHMKNLLLTTFTYELPDSLAAISQTASELIKPQSCQDTSKHAELTETLRKEVERLNALIAELPKIIESG